MMKKYGHLTLSTSSFSNRCIRIRSDPSRTQSWYPRYTRQLSASRKGARDMDLTRNVNKMALNLTNQVRSISEVTSPSGRTTQLEQVCRGRCTMLDLKETIIVNTMVLQLSTLASEVTHVSLEVGTEGIAVKRLCQRSKANGRG
ncbi:hypothetical protein BT96DRAFT_1091052 [Gymnopus androsaceus JB14]|uniref:Uncharacterized protein n=1 Tax=Gymnopus androsaceus JB14 TaxID=1447944 RepID=A0A6A4HV26_9AGAR|nr:hypothetical protein BT96DRAFT_1091052 [Gymnopus androsaceus JB14]